VPLGCVELPMKTDTIITDVIYPALAEVLNDSRIDASPHLRPDTSLFGQGSPLDSLGLVSLLAIVEERIQTSQKRDIVLASEEVFSRAHSPFRTVGALADYVVELLAE
jgi:acyl carrier protein